MNIQEIQIPAPWGHVAVKLWGDQKNEAVITFHGLMDNAASFDNLIPLLPHSLCYICVDLPGHGLSSHFPSGVPIHTTDNFLACKVVVEHFGRKNYIFLGHSYGGQIGLMFAQMYPHFVSKIINLDTVYFYPSHPNYFLEQLIASHEQLLSMMKRGKDKRPVYRYEEALGKLIVNRTFGKLTRKSAEPLLKRMIRKVGEDQYVFTLDNRLKRYLNPSSNFQYLIDLFDKKPVRCPVLLILARESRVQALYFTDIIKFFKKLKFEIKVVDGSHLVHTEFPEKVATIITKFLLSKKQKL